MDTPSPILATATSKPRIYVVEDEAIVARDIAEQIKQLGYEFAGHSATGEDALIRIGRSNTDLVLLDISLDGVLDGIDVAERLRARVGLRCIFISAYSTQQILDRAKRVEPLGYLLKPFSERELQAVLEMAIYRAFSDSRLLLRDAAIRSVSEGIVFTGPDRLVTSANPAFCSITGYSEAEVVGRSCRFLQGPETSPSTVAEINATVLRQDVFAGEILNYRKDGTTFWNDLTISPLRDVGGFLVGYVGVTREVTERKRTVEAEMNAQRMQTVGTLAGGIAHDLNNILAPVLICANLLRTEINTTEGLRLVDLIETSARRGGETLRQLLTFGRGTAGERQPVQVALICREVVHLVRETFPRDIEVSIKIGPNVPLVLAEPTQLHLILLNLMVNARDAMPNGGRLSVTLEQRQLPESMAGVAPEERTREFVCVEIKDTGHGIEESIRSRIFEPFFTTKPIGKGTGLGLSTVIGILKSHGGYVHVESSVGAGAAFQIFLPCAEAIESITAPAATSQGRHGEGQLVLVVDDEFSIRDSLRAVLEGQGYSVILAAEGCEGLALFQQRASAIQLVISDLMMPVVGGLSLIRSIRSTPSAVPVIAMTGMPSAEQSAQLAELGVSVELAKPFVVHDLLVAVSKILSGVA